jgi:hypothetical protein
MAADPRPPALRDALRDLWVQALVAEVRRRLAETTDGSPGGPARVEEEPPISRAFASKPAKRHVQRSASVRPLRGSRRKVREQVGAITARP